MKSITVAGGVYQEQSRFPRVDNIWGSGGRAAAVLAGFGCRVGLQTIAAEYATSHMKGVGASLGFSVEAAPLEATRTFSYLHCLAEPTVYPPISQATPLRLSVQAEVALVFGTVEAQYQVDAKWVVYDPQSPGHPMPLDIANPSGCSIAYVLNAREAAMLGNEAEPAAAARNIAEKQRASVVVVKLGANGALVLDRGKIAVVPAYASDRVYSIGSGDVFSATFAYEWAVEGESAIQAAERASRSTALYVNDTVLPIERGDFLDAASFRFPALKEVGPLDHDEFDVYLAGPFFNIAQQWLVDESRAALRALGLRVFSPFHDVGLGSGKDVASLDLDGLKRSRAVLAIADGQDSGTMVEIGFARALGKPVVVLAENVEPEALTMIAGTDCVVTRDFVTAMYKSAWAPRL